MSGEDGTRVYDPIKLAVSLLPFTVAMSFTPGPNNLMLASAGARFGFARTLPQQGAW